MPGKPFKRRKERRKPQRIDAKEYKRIFRGSVKYHELLGILPKRMHALLGYSIFPNRVHIARLHLTPEFLQRLTSETRVLEIGSGTARLTDWILRNSRMKPENYEIVDLAYNESPPWIKKRVHKLAKKGKLKMRKADMFTVELPRDHYDHILIPEAFFAFKNPEYEKRLASVPPEIPVIQIRIQILQELIERLRPALRANGTIRISNITEAKEIANNPKYFQGFQIEVHTDGLGYGLVLRLKNKPN